MVFLRKLKLISCSISPHYHNCSVPTFLILFKKLLALTTFTVEGTDYAFYMRDYKVDKIKPLKFYMTDFLFTGLERHNIWKRKLKIRWKMTYLKWPLYFWTKFTVIWVSSHRHQISSEEFPDALRSIFFDCFLATIFCSTQKLYVSEYVCKTCLKELDILLKCRETFAKLLAAWNPSKNTGLPQFFCYTVFKENQFSNKNQKFLIVLTFMNSKLQHDWQ